MSRRKPHQEALPQHGDRKGCPSMSDCRGGTSARQAPLTEGQIAQVSEKARERAGAANEKMARCSYCGRVYMAHSRTILGFLGGMRGEGWHGP